MRLLQLADAVAIACAVSPGRTLSLVRRFQDAGLFPKGNGGSNAATGEVGHATVLVLAELTGASGPIVARETIDYMNFRHDDLTAGVLITGLMAQGICADDDDALDALGRCSVTVYGHACPAVAVRLHDGATSVERVFTPDGDPWRPDDTHGVVRSASISGLSLMRLATAMRGLLTGETVQ